MRRFIIIAALALGLGGCAELQTLSELSSVAQTAALSPKAVFIGANAFDAIEITATNYLDQCPRATPTGLCYGADKVRPVIIPAIRSGIIVRRKLVAAARAAGGGPIAAGADWSTLRAVTATIKDILAQYGVPVGQ